VAGDHLGCAVDALEDVGDGATSAPVAYALAIGGPGGNVSGHNDAGGFKTANDDGNSTSVVNQDTTEVPGAAEAGDRFGTALAVVVGKQEQAILVGVPDDVRTASGWST
jgi:hypothetical protein